MTSQMDLQEVPDLEESRSGFSFVLLFVPLMVVLGLALPILVYLGVMQANGWTPPQLGSNAVLAAVMGKSDRVLLYKSPSTQTYFTGIGGNYDTLVTPWRLYFADRKLSIEETADIARLRKLKSGVLILPSAVSLNSEERSEIAAFRGRGGSILATWATGTRNGAGAWDGWQFMGALGVSMVGEMPAATEANHLVLTGESPVSHSQLSGQRIWMSKTSENLLRLKGPMVAGRFMNWARIPDEERKDEGAVVYSEASSGGARAVVFAFSESTWESHPLDAYGLLDDAIKWLTHEPVAVRASWPMAKRSANIIEMDTEDGFANALNFSSMMKRLEIPATFYILTSVAKNFPEVLARLARDFELGYHADVHTGFKGQAAELQEKRIKAMRSDIEGMFIDANRLTGFRAPTESYDTITEQLLLKNGVRHHAGDPGRVDFRLPIFAKMENVDNQDALVVLPRTQRDDINLYWEKLTPEQTAKALVADFDLSVELGSLGLLSIHSQNFGLDSTLTKAMPSFLEHVKQQRALVWLASAGQVADWWRERDRFKMSSKYSGKRLEFNITITGSKPLSDAAIIVMLPQIGVVTSVKNLKVGQPMPTISKVDDYRAAIVFDKLKPGNYSYQATFSKP